MLKFGTRVMLLSCLWSHCLLTPAAGDVATRTSPTELEQYMLELLNRARANPSAEVTRLSGEFWGDAGVSQPADLNEGLTSGTITSTAKPPLAFSMDLVTAASNHAQHQLQADAWGHYEGATDVGDCWTGNSPSDRATAAGYAGGVGENTAVAVTSASWPTNASQTAQAEARHNGLFVDDNVPGRGHRLNFMNSSYTEVGIGFYFGSNYQGPFSSTWNSVNMANYNFGSVAGPQLTGVLFQDHDGDSFYTPDGTEYLGGQTIQLKDGSGTVVASGTTYGDSGGYNIDISSLSPGGYSLMVSGFDLDCGANCLLTIPPGGATQNIGLTLTASAVPEPGAWQYLGLICLAVGIRSRYRREFAK